jgi:hypothetical protein
MTYYAWLTQSGTAAPVSTDVKNTLGGAVSWSRHAIGYYFGQTTIPFTELAKCWLGMTGFSTGTGNTLMVPISDYAGIIGWAVWNLVSDGGFANITLEIYDAAYASADLETVIGSGNKLHVPPFEYVP